MTVWSSLYILATRLLNSSQGLIAQFNLLSHSTSDELCVQFETDINKLYIEAVFTVEVDLIAQVQLDEHRPGRHLVAPIVVVPSEAGVEVGLLDHVVVLVEVDEAAGVLGVVVGVEGEGDLVDPGHLTGEHS